MLKASFDFKKVSAELDKITQAAEKSVRPAAQEGAQVFYDRMKSNVPVKTGKLKSAVYQVYSQENSDNSRATYHISVNKKKAPHWHLIENGTSRMAARPFIRPTYTAVAKAAMRATRTRMLSEVKKVL